MTRPVPTKNECDRLQEARAGRKWRRWGTYLSLRQWGTVREDYSASGDAWRYLTYEDAVLRAYRWGEDGLLGISDNRGLVHFAPTLWNESDPILKERLFGLSGPEGNHGEDVKEVYYFLDGTPTHSYAKAIYKYPQRRFPCEAIREAAARAGRNVREPEIWDFGVFDDDAYFDVLVEYAKVDVEDLIIRLTVTNRGRNAAPVHLLPTIWFRNTWSWQEPVLEDSFFWAESPKRGYRTIAMQQTHLGARRLYIEAPTQDGPELLFTENETNFEALHGTPNRTPYTKDAFHRYVVSGETAAVNPEKRGSKAAAHVRWVLGPGESKVMHLRFTDTPLEAPFANIGALFEERIADAHAFYDGIMPSGLSQEERAVYRQAMAGLLWTKQFYCFDVDRWLRGDPAYPAPPQERMNGRNHDWRSLYNSEILSVPDKWEFPWYAAWDLAFHCLPFALIDAEFARTQLTLLLREWYMHPNGRLPAYEWAFGDVNPPVHAWAALRVYQIERRMTGNLDRAFLESVFHKLMLNFTWWVNRKDADGKNVFEGGFLGLDNIGVFDRSNALPEGGTLEQADATSWMGMYCLNLLAMSLELARENPSYQDVANKYFEHFLYIARAMNGNPSSRLGKDKKKKMREGEDSVCLWDEEDGFFYDVLRLPGNQYAPLKVRSMVGIIPLFAVETIDDELLQQFPAFVKRVRWFVVNRPELGAYVAQFQGFGHSRPGGRHILSLVGPERLARILRRVLDENEFLSPYGIRSLSRVHLEKPYSLAINGAVHQVAYEPGESGSGLFGGNSNWRGPIWFPVNYLLIEALQKYHHFYGDELKVECPTGSGKWMNLWDVSSELSRRLASLFLRGKDGRRPIDGSQEKLERDPHFRDYLIFPEYFHGDTGAGLGANHQTGWTALVAKLLQQSPLWRDREKEK
ncbi:glucosidase [Pendulispora brunnea]|uniref:Glucosidase n=1 Tax=Pendulispora brunnea TaxID=2905690 RepID=A0ABZ2KJC5_9BACT